MLTVVRIFEMSEHISKLMDMPRVKALLDSPTMNSWLVFGLKPLNFILVLPLVLTRLETAEVAVFYLFSAATGIMAMLGFGFHPTFIRMIGYLVNGVSVAQMMDGRVERHEEKGAKELFNVEALSAFFRMMLGVYRIIALAVLVLALLFLSPLLLPYILLLSSLFIPLLKLELLLPIILLTTPLTL